MPKGQVLKRMRLLRRVPSNKCNHSLLLQGLKEGKRKKRQMKTVDLMRISVIHLNLLTRRPFLWLGN